MTLLYSNDDTYVIQYERSIIIEFTELFFIVDPLKAVALLS